MTDLPADDVSIWGFPFRELVDANEALHDHARTDLITLTQLAQAGAKISRQVRLLGVMGDAYLKRASDGRDYVIFKGRPGLRPHLPGTRYLRENPKLSCFVVGTRDIIEDAARGVKIAVIAFVALDIVKECLSDHPSMAALGVSIVSDVVQAALSAGAGVVVGAILGGMVGAPVVITFAAAITAGFAAGYALATIDGDFRLTERARAIMIRVENTQGTWLQRTEHAVSSVAHDAGEKISVGVSYIGRAWTAEVDSLLQHASSFAASL